MPNENLTEILCVLDRSGSMRALAEEVIAGYNHFIEEQRCQPGEARVTLALFDHGYFRVYQSLPLSSVPALTAVQYEPDGYTALLDALGHTIDDAGAEFSRRREEDKPARVIMLIMTDGKENMSVDYRRPQIVERVERQRRQWKWEFVFLGANIDAFAEGHGLGIDRRAIADYVPSGAGVRSAFYMMSNVTSSYRSGGDAQFPTHQQ
jgi:uncharacterized protein YegL